MSKKINNLPNYKQKAKCLEFLCVRTLLMIPYVISMAIIGFIYGIITMFTGFINCFTVVCTQKHWEPHYNFVTKLARWTAHINMYLSGATQDRPACCSP